MRAWLRAIRIPFLTATIVPLALGSIVAWHGAGGFLWARFWLAAAGALLVHVGTNLVDEYGDHVTGNDAANPGSTLLSGGSRVIQEGLLSPRSVLAAGVASLALGGCVGIYLNAMIPGNVLLILGSIGIFLGYFYSSAPLRIGYRGLGELAVAVGFGPLIVAGAYYVQVEDLDPRIFLISLPVAILIALVLLINGFPDRDADLAVGKRTLVVLLGKPRAVVLYNVLLVIAYALIAILVSLRIMPRASLLTLLAAPVAWRASAVLRSNYGRVRELVPANAATIALHSLVGGLLVLGFALDRMF
jgi:1,4-dihydroxy-2-naphthoate octaprenyltransferase